MTRRLSAPLGLGVYEGLDGYYQHFFLALDVALPVFKFMPSHIKVLESLSTFVDTRSLIIILTLAYFLCIYAPFEG